MLKGIIPMPVDHQLTHTHSYTHIFTHTFSSKLTDADSDRCVVATNGIEINLCGAAAPDNMRRAPRASINLFFFLLFVSSPLFSVRGWTEVEVGHGRKKRSLRGNKSPSYKKHMACSVSYRSQGLQNLYRSKLCPWLNAMLAWGWSDDDDTPNGHSPTVTQTDVLLSQSNVKLPTVRQKVRWNNIHSALTKQKWQ